MTDVARSYRLRAEELRTIADNIRERSAVDALRRVARRYDMMADWRELRVAHSADGVGDVAWEQRDTDRYRARAQALRVLANNTRDGEGRKALLDIAAGYDEMASDLAALDAPVT